MSVGLASDRIKATYLSLHRRLRSAQVEQRRLEDDIGQLQENCNRFTGHHYPQGSDRCEYCDRQKGGTK